MILLGNPYLLDDFSSACLVRRNFRLRPLLSLIRPFHILIIFIAIPFPRFTNELVVVPFGRRQVIIGELAIRLFQLALVLHPFSFGLIRMHGFRFLCEIALSPVRQYGEKTDSDVVRIAQLERINEGEPLGECCCIYQSYFNEENLSDIAFGCGSI